jgi:hypothetical protein
LKRPTSVLIVFFLMEHFWSSGPVQIILNQSVPFIYVAKSHWYIEHQIEEQMQAMMMHAQKKLTHRHLYAKYTIVTFPYNCFFFEKLNATIT